MECGPVILSFLGKMKVVIHEVWTCYPVIPGEDEGCDT